MEYSLRPLVIEIPIDSWLVDSIGAALLVLIVAAILKVVFGDPPERRGASEMRPHLGGYQPRDTPPTMQSPPSDGRRPQRPPPPKPIARRPCDIARDAGVLVTRRDCAALNSQTCVECRKLQTGESIPTAEELLAATPIQPECQMVYEGFTASPKRPPPPKPIDRHHDCDCYNMAHGMTIPPPPPRRRCPSKGFGEPISCDECDRGCPPGKK